MPFFDEIIAVRLQKQQVIEGVGRRWSEQVLSVCWTRTFFTEASPCVHIDNIYVLLFQRGDRLYTSESDVCRHQILMCKDGVFFFKMT